MLRIRATSYYPRRKPVTASTNQVDDFYEMTRDFITDCMHQYVNSLGIYDRYSGIPYFDVGAKEYTEDRYGYPIIIFEVVLKSDKSGNWETVGELSMCTVDVSTGRDIYRLTREDKKYIQENCQEIVDRALSAKGFI